MSDKHDAVFWRAEASRLQDNQKGMQVTLKGVCDHMNYCRKLLGVPEDETFAVAILQLKERAEKAEKDLERCSNRIITLELENALLRQGSK